MKSALKNTMNLPHFILLEPTGKEEGLPLFTCHTSIKTVNARTNWMNEKSKHCSDVAQSLSVNSLRRRIRGERAGNA